MGKKKNDGTEQADVFHGLEDDRETAIALPDPEEDMPLAISVEVEEDRSRATGDLALLPKVRKKRTFTHKVTDYAGTILRDGVTYNTGEGLNLTDEEARLLGPSVEPA